MKIEYGIPTDTAAIQLRLGIEQGFFRQHGLELSLRVVFGGPEIAAMYDSGALKVGELGSPPATTALAKGGRFKIIGSGVPRRALQYFVAHPSISSWSDLRGKTVAALSIGSCSYWFGRMVLDRHGLDPDRDIRHIGLGPRYPEVIELFQAGELQAAVLAEPHIAIGEYHGAFRVLKALTEVDFCPAMQWTVTVAHDEVIALEPELVRAVLCGCRDSYRFAAENPQELARFAAARFGIDLPTMLRAFAREQPGQHDDCDVDMDGLDLAIDLQHRLGAFSTPLRARDITDLRFVPDKAGATA